MDRSELEREMERLHRESWVWALACCGRRRELAEEALQFAYLRVLSGQVRFDGRSSLKTWLFGVIRFASIEEMRRSAIADARSVDVETAFALTDPALGAQGEAERSEERATLLAALSELSPRQREALQLVFYHDMTLEEAAIVMRVSVGSARTQYDRGKKSLAKRLSPYDSR